MARQCPGQFLAGERDVGVGGVDQRHAQIESLVGTLGAERSAGSVNCWEFGPLAAAVHQAANGFGHC
jgi:hypothetical protein